MSPTATFYSCVLKVYSCFLNRAESFEGKVVHPSSAKRRHDKLVHKLGFAPPIFIHLFVRVVNDSSEATREIAERNETQEDVNGRLTRSLPYFVCATNGQQSCCGNSLSSSFSKK